MENNIDTFGVVLVGLMEEESIFDASNVGSMNRSYRAELYGLLELVTIINTLLQIVCNPKNNVHIYIDNEGSGYQTQLIKYWSTNT